MLNRKECKKMLVWDDKREDAVKRVVIDVVHDGSCYAISSDAESSFLEGGMFRIIWWGHCEEIKEPEWQAFTDNSQLEPYIDCWFRKKNIQSKKFARPTYYDSEAKVISMCGRWWNTRELFDEWEMKVNGVWQPVGELK